MASLACFHFSASSSSSAPPNAPNLKTISNVLFNNWIRLVVVVVSNVLFPASTELRRNGGNCTWRSTMRWQLEQQLLPSLWKITHPAKSLEVGDYLKAINSLDDMKLGFKDAQMCLFRPKLNVLINLVDLHYCLIWLRIPGDQLKEALLMSEIADRHVCIKWWKLGRWFYGFCMKDESHPDGSR